MEFLIWPNLPFSCLPCRMSSSESWRHLQLYLLQVGPPPFPTASSIGHSSMPPSYCASYHGGCLMKVYCSCIGVTLLWSDVALESLHCGDIEQEWLHQRGWITERWDVGMLGCLKSHAGDGTINALLPSVPYPLCGRFPRWGSRFLSSHCER